MSLPSIIVLTGPTGIGKTETGVRLATKINAEIISADSMQVYRRFDIGAAKPTPELRREITHHLVDFVEPNEEFNASIFRLEAGEIITDLRKKGKRPLVVGGTGLYIKALTHGLGCALKPSGAIRKQLKKEIDEMGVQKMHEELVRVDPVSARTINPRDWLRIQRALEIFRATGRPLSVFHEEDKNKSAPQYMVSCFILNMPREKIYKRIENRVDSMLKNGLVHEVETLLREGYARDLKPFMGLGYKQVLSYLEGKDDYQTMVDRIKKETRHYAKRQLTWFRKIESATWINIEEGEKAEDIVHKILGYLSQ